MTNKHEFELNASSAAALELSRMAYCTVDVSSTLQKSQVENWFIENGLVQTLPNIEPLSSKVDV